MYRVVQAGRAAVLLRRHHATRLCPVHTTFVSTRRPSSKEGIPSWVQYVTQSKSLPAELVSTHLVVSTASLSLFAHVQPEESAIPAAAGTRPTILQCTAVVPLCTLPCMHSEVPGFLLSCVRVVFVLCCCPSSRSIVDRSLYSVPWRADTPIPYILHVSQGRLTSNLPLLRR